MDEKNMRNCRVRANKNQTRVVQVQVILLWVMGQTNYPLYGPSSLISAIAVPVCCRKAPLSASHVQISLPSHLCKTPSSMQAASPVHGTAAGCSCNGDNLMPRPVSGAQLHPTGTGAWVSPQGSSVWGAGSSWQQCFLCPDPTTVLPVLSSCCSNFCWSRCIKIIFSFGPWL